MIAAVLRWLPLSLALHSVALAATLLLPRDSALVPLFVDLTLAEPLAPPDGRTAAPERSESAAAPRAALSPPSSRAPDMPPPASPSASAPAPRVAAPEPPAPPAPAAIEPAPPPAVVESSDELPIASAPSPAPVGTTAPGGSATSSPAEPAATGAVSSGAAVPGGGGGTTVGPAANGGSAATGAGAGETLALGISGDDGDVYAGYIALLRRRVQEGLSYPSAARRRGMTGTVHLDISVESTGRIADVLVVRSSSHDLLDAAALDAVRALRRVPFPPGVRPRAVRVRLPVVFELR